MKNSTVLPGIILICAGLLLLGENMGWINYSLFRILFSWQMLLIVLGLSSFANKRVTGGLILTGIGIVFLLPRINDVWDTYTHTYWPLLLILLGVVVLLKRMDGKNNSCRHTNASETVYTSEDGFVNLDTTFGSIKQIFIDPIFKGAKLRNAFGATVLDLRRTKLETPETYIDVDCRFGGIEIYMPDSWVIVIEANVTFGGIDDKRISSNVESDNKHKVIIRGRVLFSGLEIKN